ncbi:unnamed protein product [Cylicocyclus nassatus]|uniref:Nose resistant-to-fluoxetine protein N-terminal domain-containing protein n=1 Tax=Cylicocyclus nassatus TaxID=53992 RepID=A0AA36M6E3_CYLNA|nr:unnamed protein product [Cylicocyclus nassatus]
MWRLILLCASTYACSLCPLRVPPRPRPLDQFKLPSIPDLNLETLPEFCNFSRQLDVEEQCRKGFEKLFCATDDSLDSLICNGQLESQKRCSSCAHKWEQSKWAMTWWDSLGKPAAGVSDGNYYWLGDYELCSKLRTDGKFDGQYCRIELEVPDALVEEGCPQTDPLAIVLGACMPRSCTDEQLHGLIQDYSPYKLMIDCELDIHFSTPSLIMIATLTAWVALQIAVTFFSPESLIWMCFNIRINARRALSTKRSPESLHALHGLEFITFVWFITGMVYNLMQPYIENVAFSYDSIPYFAIHLTNNYSYLVDGLLALSALYTTYLLYGEVITIKDVLQTLAKALVRFWPAYAFCVLFMWHLFPELSSGPMWIHGDTVERCSSSWWKNLLFISNLYTLRDTCVDFGYVVSLEAQYFVPLIFLTHLARSRLFTAKVLSVVLLSLSISFAFYRAFLGNLPPAPLLTAEPIAPERIELMLNNLVLSPLTRASPTLIGFLFGICMWNEDGLISKDVLSKFFIMIMTSFSAFAGLFVMFSLLPYATYSIGHPVFLAFYAAFHRPLWATSLLSFLYLSHHGSFEWIHAILTWRIFSPLSKLTWIALILAEPIILFFFSALNRPSHATNWSTIYAAISASTISYLMALLIDIFLTRPIRGLLDREELHRYTVAQAEYEAAQQVE